MANFTKQAIKASFMKTLAQQVPPLDRDIDRKASFMKLLSQKPLSKISVRDIVEDCGINRNSFYYHFQDIPSLLGEIVTEQTDALIRQYPSISSVEECFSVAFHTARENRRAVMHIFNSANRDMFLQDTLRLCEYVVSTYISTVFSGENIGVDDRRVVVQFMKCQLFGVWIDWVSGGMKEEALADLQRMIQLCRGVPELIVSHSSRQEP